MPLGLTVTKDDVETLSVRLQATGLVAGERYDVLRLQLRYLGDDDTGAPVYEREIPDRPALWRTVGHRMGWVAPATTAEFRDYETPMRPTCYYICLTSAGGPHEYTGWATAPYPVSRGVLSPINQAVHFNRDITELVDGGPIMPACRILIRSTAELSRFHTAEIVDLDEIKYTARGTEHAVMGTQYPVYISDTREARRGTLTLLTRDLGDYNEVRSLVFPSDGRISPVILNSGGEAQLLDDMVCVPLDVNIEQVTPEDVNLRYIRIDYVEVSPSLALTHRSGDNDTLIDEPHAQFTISDTTPARGQWITLTDTSTGQYDIWDWTIERGWETDNKVGKWYTEGPHRVRWKIRGKKTVKLRVWGSGAGASTRTRVVTVR